MLLKQKLALLAAAKAKVAAAEEKIFLPLQPWDDVIAAHDEFRAAHRAIKIMKAKWRNAA
jgi:hypothetical protein